MKSYRAIAEYYDPENSNCGMLQHDVPFFLSHLPEKKQSILELAVGTARAAIPIAQAGHRVVGIDYAPDMLAIARQKRDAANIPEKNLSLLHADILTLDLHQQFDWIAIFFNSFLGFTTLADQDAALSAVLRHLKPRGKFWLDIFQPNLPLLAADTSENLEPHIFYVPHLSRTVYQSTTIQPDPAAQLQQITFNYTWFTSTGRPRHQKVRFALTFIFPRELRILLERHGLEIESLYGDYNASPLTSDSPRIIALCRRQSKR